MSSPQHSSSAANQAVAAALDTFLADLRQKNANPLASHPLWPYRDKIAALLKEQATSEQLAELFTQAGLEVSATTVARFIREAQLRKKQRTRRSAAASR